MDAHPCRVCETEFVARAGTMYCSRRCNDHAKTLRYHADPEYRDRMRLYGREKAQRKRDAAKALLPPKVTVVCSLCCAPNYARGMCRPHYGKWQREHAEETAVRRIVVNALVSHGPDSEHRRVNARITVGLLVECPGCAWVMGATSPVARSCHRCLTTLILL